MVLKINKNTRFVVDLKIDILSRLLYGLRIDYSGTHYDAYAYNNETEQIVLRGSDCDILVNIEHVRLRPLLRRMSSMTDKEKIKYETLLANAAADGEVWKVTDWLDRNMFDYRGLIDGGLAVEII